MRLNKLTSQLHSKVNWNKFVCQKPTTNNRCMHFFLLLHKFTGARVHQYRYGHYTCASLQAGQAIRHHTHSHMNTCASEQRLCVAAATRSDPWHSLPITLSSTYQSSSLFIPCLLMLTLGFFAACAHKHARTHSQWHANICGASCWQWSRSGHDCLAVFV